MTQDNVMDDTISTLLNIKSSCEKLINDTQIDLKIFKIEHDDLRQQLIEIAEENSRLKRQLEVITSSNSLFQTTKDGGGNKRRCSNDLIEILQEQIQALQIENEEFKALEDFLRKTIDNHEKEIQSYKDFVFGSGAENNLQSELRSIQDIHDGLRKKELKLNEKLLYIECLEKQNKELVEQNEMLQKQLLDAQTNTNQKECLIKMQRVIESSTKEKLALQSSLQAAARVITERMDKERDALQKMAEALGIAEAAVIEREEMQKNSDILEQEREFLASTIGQVLEEASKKFDEQTQKLRRQIEDYKKRIQTVTKEHEANSAKQQKDYNCLETLYKGVSEQNKIVCQENEKLRKQQDFLQKALNKIGGKIQSNGNLLIDDKEDKKQIEKLKSEIQQLNEKCKFTVDDITHEFQKTLKRLSCENAELKAQIKILCDHKVK